VEVLHAVLDSRKVAEAAPAACLPKEIAEGQAKELEDIE
jgi:hypothetical protein